VNSLNTLQIVVLAIVQGAAELLPVSSSAHVIVAEKAMGLDPSSPEMTLLLVMLHTGTMFAVILYFWGSWRETYFSSWAAFRRRGLDVVIGTAATGIVGLALMQSIKWLFARHDPGFEIEQLFGNSLLMAASLACAGLLILLTAAVDAHGAADITPRSAAWIGAVQGLCLPFRGFSRSGATISVGIVIGVARRRAEEFSFALAVVLTPAVIVREAWRLAKAHEAVAVSSHAARAAMLAPGLLGMVLSFVAGLAALRWLSRWLETGRWYLFGLYCLLASLVVLGVG
jgi:undecaprenyl-diphosphatase